MLKTAEVEIKKEHIVLMVNKPVDFKKSDKKMKDNKGKPKKGVNSVTGPPTAPKLKPDVTCFYCKGDDYWKRNCHKYLEDKKSDKIVERDKGICDIHVIDINLTSAWSNTWVFDINYVAHICNSQEELWNKRCLARNKVMMHFGNDCKVDVLAVDTLILILNKCYFIPMLSINIVRGSCMMRDNYLFKSETNGCSICINNIFYVHAPDRDGLFLINIDCNDFHINSIDSKICKPDNDNTMYMWHCLLGHIG
jgi:hypothetical protein